MADEKMGIRYSQVYGGQLVDGIQVAAHRPSKHNRDGGLNKTTSVTEQLPRPVPCISHSPPLQH